MKDKKCVVFNFAKGRREDTSYYHYKNGQLDLDLKIEVRSLDEVRSSEPPYGSNVLDFKKLVKVKKNGSSMEGLEEPFNIA